MKSQENSLISIIVPIYNVEEYLIDCLKSIANQSYKNIEVLLIDDGSTDKSGQLCESWVKDDQRFRVFHKMNGGLSDARNYGIEYATGEYIVFIDSDDFISEFMIETLYRIAEKTSSDIICSSFSEIDESKSYQINNNKIKPSERFKVINGSNDIMKSYLSESNIGTVAWNKLYNKRLFEEIRFPINRYHEDVFTTYRLLSICNRVAYTKEKLYFYRQRFNSITQSKFSLKHLDGIYGALEKYDYISEHYSSLRELASKDIVYACNHCIIRMINARYNEKKVWSFIQKLYRLHGWQYIRGKRKLSAKMFTIVAMININLLKRLSFLFANKT